ncbi:MAG: glycosyltransferase family 2 protein [Candidatus Omnitrophica bacterium]|nr:glycosyltransferase family 2 protein [Candidatus Omnitrophota bacterium]MCM8826854.1 glycosyltransferase family 2 protein [Candidatus Omnitrophota bacterium]
MRIWLIIPAYNECESLGRLLKEIKKYNLSILVVDDGSKDNTYSIAINLADKVIRNDRNRGKGVSLKQAKQFLIENVDFDYIITMDADNQHDPSDIYKFIEEAKNGEYFVIGNRMYNPQGMPLIRVWTNRLMSWFISKIVRQNIPDTQCGFRLIRRKVLEVIDTESNKFEIESELLIKAARKGFPIKSIPIKSIYFKNHRSKINPLIDTLRFIRFIFKLIHE